MTFRRREGVLVCIMKIDYSCGVDLVVDCFRRRHFVYPEISSVIIIISECADVKILLFIQGKVFPTIVRMIEVNHFDYITGGVKAVKNRVPVVVVRP
jgi:hypothetical protein